MQLGIDQKNIIILNKVRSYHIEYQDGRERSDGTTLQFEYIYICEQHIIQKVIERYMNIFLALLQALQVAFKHSQDLYVVVDQTNILIDLICIPQLSDIRLWSQSQYFCTIYV